MTNTIFHPGELEMQQLAGAQASAAKLGHLIENSVPARALAFIRKQTAIWVGVDDDEGWPWAFPIFGPPGFIHPHDGGLLDIGLCRDFPIPDGWLTNLHNGKAIGCLLIDLANRQRLRINGAINANDGNRLRLDVRQAYPNCQKYITKRAMPTPPNACRFHLNASGDTLDSVLENLIGQADTAFVASLGPNGADMSHRDGLAGFISHAHGKITIPDYPGNNLFNTLGNFKLAPYGGLTIVEFGQGYFLQLSGEVNILFGQRHLTTETGGTHRLWELTIHKWRLYQLAAMAADA